MKVKVFHNVTEDNGRLAIFGRSGERRVKSGDKLQFVGTLDFPEATTFTGAADLAFEAGNSPAETDAVKEYRSWKVRSLSVGDVVAIEDGRHPVMALDCRSTGWGFTDLAQFEFTGGPEGPALIKADTDRTNLDAALTLIREHCPRAVAVHLQTSDQSLYGFTLSSVECKPGDATGGLLPDWIEDEVSDLLSDLDWDSVVGESPQGGARIALP